MLAKKLLAVCLVVMILICLAGCSKLFRDEEESPEMIEEELPLESESAQAHDTQAEVSGKMRETVFYLLDASDELVPTVKEIPLVTGIARAAVNGLIDSEQLRAELADNGLKPPLPEGTEVRGLTIRDGLAKIDLNDSYLNVPNQKAEKHAVKAIVYTLTEFSNVQKVQIMINGKVIDKMPFGTPIGKPLARNDIAHSGLGDGSGFPITLYFAPDSDEQGIEAVVPVMARVDSSQKDNLVKDVVEKLIAGPEVEGSDTVSVFPEGAKLLECEVKDSTAVLTFSKELVDYGGGRAAEEALVKSIVFTVISLPGIEQVKINVESIGDYLPEGTYIGKPFAGGSV